LPRKYHRPPTTKRRKERKTNVPYAVPEEAMATNGGSVALEDDEGGVLEDGAVVEAAPPENRAPRGSAAGHIQRDYSYVRTELVRIAVVAAFLVVALIVTAILRG
jgi:hypothetical protein